MSYAPIFKGVIEGYTVNYLHEHHWKIARSVPWDDAMQTAYVVFLRCKRKFPRSKALNTPQAFMALYKRAWANEFTDMANADTEKRCELQEPPTPLAEPIGDLDNDGMLNIMIREAPREIQMVIALFLNTPQEVLELALSAWRDGGHNGAGGNRHIAKLLGLDPRIDTLKLVEDYFTDKPV